MLLIFVMYLVKNAILFLLAVSTFITTFSSCSKEQFKNENETGANDQQSRAIVQLIRNFDTKLSADFKSGESLSIDSVVWYSEALQNYHNARPDLQYEAIKVSKQTYTLTIENGLIDMNAIAALYQDMDNDRVQQMLALDEGDNYLKLTDVSLDSVVGTTAYLSSTNIFGLRLIEGLYLPFQDGDDWIWGTLGQENGEPPVGKCDGSMYGVSDASDELAWKLNHPVVSSVPYVFVNIVSKEANGILFPDERLYTGWDYPQQNCLTSDTLNHYLTQSHKIINNFSEGLRPPGKECSHVVIYDYLLMWSGGGRYIHHYEVYYGDKIILGHAEE